MNIDKRLIRYEKLEIDDLTTLVENLSEHQWSADKVLRTALATNRPGDAIYLLNNVHHQVRKDANAEFTAGKVNVLRFPAWHNAASMVEPIIKNLPSAYANSNAVRVQLARLRPDETIQPHVDKSYLTLMHRLHIPVLTDKRVEFIVDKRSFALEKGYLYELNNMREHAVYNRSTIDRVHLMIDLLPESTARVKYHDSIASMARG